MQTQTLQPRLKRTRRSLLSATAPLFALVLGNVVSFSARGEDNAQATVAGPWISSVSWVDDQQVVGTQSQGLLLRPASVVRAGVDDLAALEKIGESETSLWCVQGLGDGKFLASDYKGGLAVYGNGEATPIQVEARWIRTLEKSPEAGQWLAGTEDGKLLVVSIGEVKELRRIDASAAAIFDIAVNPAGNQVAVASGDGTIKLFSWPELTPQGSLTRGSEAVWSVLYTADGTQLVSGGADRRLQLWDVASQRSLLTLTKTPDWVTTLVHLPNSTLVVAGCMNGSVVVADYAALVAVAQVEGAKSGIWSLALSPNGQSLAAGTRKHGVVVMPATEWFETAKQIAESVKQELPPKPAPQG